MGNIATNELEKFILPYDPRAVGESVTWICMDDRFAKVEGLYRQIPGGGQGVGIDLAIASDALQLRFGRSPNYIERATGRKAPVQFLTAQATELAARENITLLNHEGCAAEAAAATISEAIVTRPDEVYPIALDFYPELTSDKYELIAEAHSQAGIADGETLAQVDKPTAWGTSTGRAVTRVPLVDISHVAGDIIADHNSKVAFDTKGALEAGTPAYHVSMGDLSEVHRAFDAHYPTRFVDFAAATAIRAAATSLFLPRPADVQNLTIHRVGV